MSKTETSGQPLPTAPAETKPAPPSADAAGPAAAPEKVREKVKEIGGPKGPEPTRYGDWDVGGRCSDF
ncbi:DUF1674 domain-containing protein [Radicibacter daui]|uniref:DUF1674 domain-containing protein n=1 Tax=Radicibacter daui TaxID=3064829 RepID=UPI00404700D5